MHSKEFSHKPPASGSSKILIVDKDKYELVHALVSSLNAPQHRKLCSIYELLFSVLQTAQTVVKGTDSQRRFSACFTELCRGALVGLADLEDYLFELRNPGRSASDAADEEIMAISETDFIKELCAYVASHTPGLTAQYLERVGLSILNKHEHQFTRSAKSASSSTLSENANNRKKRLRDTNERILEANQRQSKQPNREVSSYERIMGEGSRTISSYYTTENAFDNLGLLQESEIVVRAGATAALASNLTSLAGSSVQSTTVSSSLPGGGAYSCSIASQKSSSALLKQGITVSNDGAKTSDPSATQSNLQSIPELSYYLHPWTIPSPKNILDRVTLEKERHSTSAAALPASCAAGENGHADSQLSCALIPIFDICFAATSEELLSKWESREAMLCSMMHCSTDTNVAQQGECGRQKTPLTSLGSEPRLSTGHMSPVEGTDESVKPGDTVKKSGKEKHLRDEPINKDFFPSNVSACSTVPLHVLRDLAFNGISKLEFVYPS